MDKHQCKLCFRNFANGKALGGHMRSHLLNLKINSKPQEPQLPPAAPSAPAFEFFSSSSEEEEVPEDDQEDYEVEEDELFAYRLKENPRKSLRLLDQKISVAGVAPAAGGGGGPTVLHDGDSATETSRSGTLRRSNRIRKSGVVSYEDDQQQYYHRTENNDSRKKPKLAKLSVKMAESNLVDPEQVSSASNTNPEEQGAYLLMLMKTDSRAPKHQQQQVYEDDNEDDEDDEDSDEESDDEEIVVKVKRTRARGKYACETCNRVFRSYQALGGHKASHKKARLNHHVQEPKNEEFKENVEIIKEEEKVYECPVCLRVFASGQALGGHKRSHAAAGTSSSSSAMAANPPPATPAMDSAEPAAKHAFVDMSMIDLNLPAPLDEEELYMVSDGELVRTH